MVRSPDGCWDACKNTVRTGTLTTGTATAFGGALAPCDGSDLLPLRLRSTCSWVMPVCDTAPISEGWRVVAIPRRSTPRSVLCAPRRLRRPGLLEGLHPPERSAASWSNSSSHNPLGYCLGERPETGRGPNSARTRFLFRASPHSSIFAELGTVATPPRGTGDMCLPKACAQSQGRAAPVAARLSPVARAYPSRASAGFSCRRAFDCSIKERGEYPPGDS